MKRLILLVLSTLLILPVTINATVVTSTGRIQQNCNGVLTDYDFTFNAGDTTEVAVIVADGDGAETTLTITTDYTTSCTNDDCSSGGTVALDTASLCPSGSTITILRDTDITQTSDFTEGMPTLYETFESELDKQIRIGQQSQEQLDRSLRISAASFAEDTSVDLQIEESVADRTDKYLRFDSNGDVELTGITAAAVLDEDDMVSNSPSDAASQQSIVAYFSNDAALDEPGVIGGTTPNVITGTTITATTGFIGNLTGDVTGNADTVTNGVYTTDNLSVLSATTSSQLAGVISDETGTGVLVFSDGATLSSLVINTSVTGTGIKDEDNMVSDSATHLATQQSIKSYVDTQVTVPFTGTQTDLTGSRSISTTYTNTNGAPMLVVVQAAGTFGSANGTVSALVNSVTIQQAKAIQVTIGAGNDYAFHGTLTFVVPDTETYRVNTSGTNTVVHWSEMY